MAFLSEISSGSNINYDSYIHISDPTDLSQTAHGSSYKYTLLQLGSLLTRNIGNTDLTLESTRYITMPFDLHYDGSGNIKIGDNLTPLAKFHVKSTSGIAFRIDSATQNNVFLVSNSGIVSALNGYSINGTAFANVDSINNRNTIVGYTGAHTNINSFADNTFLGRLAGNSTTGSSNVCVGSYAGFSNTSGTSNVYINAGGNGSTTGSFQTLINTNCNANGVYNNIIGQTAGTFGVGIGTSSNLTVIGCQTAVSKANIANSIGLGFGHDITDSNQFVAGGGGTAFIKDVYFGNGVYSNSLNQPVSVTNIRSASVGFVTGTTPHTNGSCAESIIRIIPGISTGTGTSGSLQVMSSPSGTSGNTPNATFIGLEVTAKGGLNLPMLGTVRANVPVGGIYLGTDADALANGDKVLILRLT